MRAVRTWLAVVALLVAAMVIVGGATRLTESGLSIVEWKPVTGTLPPLSAQAWDAAFAAYKTIPQYREVNAGMSLAEFKTIFWWEWGHRLLGRVIGFAFLLPFLYFLWRGGLGTSLKRRLWAIFGLGALQGVAGWWMVVSGLTHRVDVSQYRLAVHLMLAIFIFAAIVWTIRQLTPRATLPAPPRARRGAQIVLWVTFIQIYLGALVAGLRAGKAYNTWPLIDGAFIPDAGRLFFETPWWRNFFDSVLTVQFSHRMGAYLLLTLATLYMIDTLRRRGDGRGSRDVVIIVLSVLLQAGLGIWTLVLEVPIGPALLHQAGALVVLTAVLVHYERLRPREAAQGVAVPAGILKPSA